MQFDQLASHLGISIPLLATIIVVLAFWTLIWKGLALWRAAHSDDKPWFVILLIVNTLGILEIIYLFLVNPRKPPAPQSDNSIS